MMSPIRVLLVDDDHEDAEHTKHVLSKIRGHREFMLEWIPAYDAALEAIRKDQYDVCLLDYFLGDRHGLSFLEEALGAGTTVPVIMLTGGADRSIEQSALAAGACDYLVKGEIAASTLERSIRHSIERGRTLAELRDSERRFRSVFDSALDAIVITDDLGRCSDANPAALELLGLERDALAGVKLTDRMMPSSYFSAAWKMLITRGTMEGDFQVAHPDGGMRTVELRAAANIVPGSHLAVMRDITERRAAEEHRLRLQTIVDAADDAIDGVSIEGLINFWSPGSERVYGYSAVEAVGQPKAMLVPPARAEELAAVLAQVMQGAVVRNWETQRVRKDGSVFEASITMTPVVENGLRIGACVITRDVSAKKQLEHRLAISDRLASVGTLAAGVAHEINNPLAAVVGNVDLAVEELGRVEGIAPGNTALAAVRELLGEASAASVRIQSITRDLRLFSRPDEVRQGSIDVRQVLESSLRMAWTEVRHRAEVRRDLQPVPPVWGNDSRVGQVFLNLIVNAAYAIREGDASANAITLATWTDEVGRAVIEIRDTGSGITPERLPHIFEPFFTSNPIGGAGLGLSICQRIVQEMGGTIDARSGEPKGATFRVMLPPARPDQLPAPPGAHTAGTSSRRRGRILVVDDEVMITTAVERSLRRDHDVTTTTSGEDALRRILDGARFDVIVCDLMMPQMTGMDLHEALSAAAEEQAEAMVFLTGGAFTERGRAFLDRISNARVDKPFSSLHLRSVIAQLVR